MLVLIFHLCVNYGEMCKMYTEQKRHQIRRLNTIHCFRHSQSFLEYIPYKQEARLFSQFIFGKIYLLSIRSTFNSPLLYNPTLTEFINEYKTDINGATASMVGIGCLASRRPGLIHTLGREKKVKGGERGRKKGKERRRKKERGERRRKEKGRKGEG